MEMKELEKVIKGLEQFKSDLKPFCGNNADWKKVDDALAMLKEQEAMEQCLKTKCIICLHCDNCDVDENGLLKEQEPKPVLPVDIRPANERFATMKLGYCPKCGKKINSVDHKNYCGECSQEVKWDG